MPGLSTAAIREIEKEIEDQQKELTSLEEDKKRIEGQLPALRANLDCLTKALTILKMKAGYVVEEPENQPNVISPIDENKRFFLLMPGSHSHLAESILKEQGTPLTWGGLSAKAKERQPDINEKSFRAAVYRLLAESKVFKKMHKKVGLLEWGNSKTESL
jgi:hypothetical protein